MKETKASTVIVLVVMLTAAVGVAIITPVLSQQAHASACNSFPFPRQDQCSSPSNVGTANAFNFNFHGQRK
jgi:hypothetical protein